MNPLVGVGLAMVAGYGVYLVHTAVALGWDGVGVGPRAGGSRAARRPLRHWMDRAGLVQVRPAELAGGMAVLALVGAGLAFVVFGGVLAPLVCGGFAATVPVTAAHGRRRRRRDQAREAWPRMIEEVRLQTTTLGRSVPQALLSVGVGAPEEMRPAFAEAQREWLISTDFSRTLDVLRARLADATADVVCETLLIAHEVGGSDIDRRLGALVEDRIQDLQARKDAEAKQAGARFARRFVLLVPGGMALAGLTIGNGRAAYQAPLGQVLVVVALALMGLCWLWAGRIMRLPEPQRVFAGEEAA
jgi:tight adherence protein B